MRVGLLRSLRWRWRLRSILGASPLLTRSVDDADIPCEFHIMTCRSDWMMALWSAWSFYIFSGVDWPLVFHDGGGIGPDIRRSITSLFPRVHWVHWDEADVLIGEALSSRNLNHLAEARLRNVMIRKLVDFAMIGSSPRFISCDSDVLFFRKPESLIASALGDGPSFVFNRDSHSMYSITRNESLEWFGLDLPENLNAGLGVISRAHVDLEFLNQAFSPGRIPFNRDAFPEQTACALLAAQSGDPAYLPDGYSVATGTPPLDLDAMGAVSRHYVGPVRHLFYEEGLPILVRKLKSHLNNHQSRSQS